ncbi:GntR family transcriptional regulator [Nonomuraea dietziae]|uniref:GntR family transcriptional regulator n=1 Tax=Nonomuraea dietziae TaxID=65515 RepID=UPI0033DB48F8
MAAEALCSRIADGLRRQIVTGELAPGERLPTEHDLAARYSTTHATVRKALAVKAAAPTSNVERPSSCSPPAPSGDLGAGEVRPTSTQR